ncbi:signal recognition particle-docking protein FtsY [Actinobacillus delphinicola]|uniref:signal recognition particle-docking protein FtsY n=1 Tax=Actinobacillus delphinicola TaxID=51161 RepID=UPI002442F4F6|nr:signal recognition particle-docking protein FtsY [Actinobacillus delphinicola]MDG6896668.1 signal recognition particle-docking protein FtsY [Actinobacillus delphinicola]
MSNESKKGGFWSLFGFGRKKKAKDIPNDEQQLETKVETELAAQETTPVAQTSAQEDVEVAEKVIAQEKAVIVEEKPTAQEENEITEQPIVESETAVIEESSDAEKATIAENQPIVESETAPIVENQPVVEEEPAVVEEQPIAEEETAVAEEQPVAEEETAIVEEQPVAEEETAVAEEQPVAEEETAIVEEQPVAEEKPAVVEEQPVAEEEPAVVEEQPVAEEETAIVEEPPVAEEEPAVVEEQPVSEEETAIVEEQPVSEEETAIVEEQPTAEEETEVVEEQPVVEKTQEKPKGRGGFFSRLVRGLVKTKQNIGSGFKGLFSGKKIDDDLFEELEEQLLIADIGVPTTTKIINNLTQHASRKQLKDADLLYQQLKQELSDIIAPVSAPLEIDSSKKPYVILMVGVNGVGKTTTIGKLARQFQQQGKSVMLAAGDTFRAAAVEQLQVWGERNNIPVIAQKTGSDSASVIFDAMQSAAAKNIDVLIADTAGRLQNKDNLMNELKKIVRVMKKYDETAPHEIMLTLDAGTGQNAISQAKLFNEAVGVTGINITKLDGSAKGGVIFAIADQFKLPIRYIGVGEQIEDLRPFNAEEFIDALFENSSEN